MLSTGSNAIDAGGATNVYIDQRGWVRSNTYDIGAYESNIAPVLADTSLSITVTEDAGVPSGTVGTLVSSLTGGMSDSDFNPSRGIAVTATSEVYGTWYYSTDGGTTWLTMGSVSAGSSLLLAADANTRIYFAPASNYFGSLSSALTFRAWDRTSGSAGTKVSTSTNGGITAFSSATDVVDVNVTAVNDAPNDLFTVPGMSNSNVIGYYGFTTTHLLGRDDAGDNSPLTLFGSPTQTTRPSAGGALDLAGGASGQYGNIAGITTGGAMTIAGWTKFDTLTGGWQRVVDFGEAYSNGPGAIYIGRLGSTNDLTFTIEKNGVYTYRANATNAISAGTWLHFAATVDGSGNMSLYVNGVLAQTVTGVAPDVAIRTNNFIGKSNWDDTAFDGAIDDLLIANGAMSASDVARLYQQTSGFTVAENASNGTLIGTVFATDPDAANTYSYSLQNSAGGRFTVNAAGEISVANGSLLNFEASSSHTIVVRATDQSNASYDETITISLTNTNDAPTVDNSGNMTLTSITEDATNNSGNTVASIIASAGGDRITDEDSGAVEGIAITSLNSGNGTWQFSTDSGVTWNAIGAVSDSSALLLRSTDSVRFVPNGQNTTSADFTFRAWDQTSGAFGTKVNASTNGGITAFSSATEIASITVTAVNDAPVLDNTGNMILTTITEDQTTNGGNTVASIIASASGDRITDVDASAVEGIAITALSSGNGTWQFSTDNGTTWNAVGAVADNSALLLRSSDLVRFVPNGQNSTTANITFRAWDQSTGTFGTKVDASTNGNTTAFSTATEIASITVTAVNDAPVATADSATAVEAGGVSNGTVGTNPSGNVLTNDTDVDTGDTRTVTGVAAGTVGSASGSVNVGVVGTYGTISINSAGAYTYTVDNNNSTVQALRTASQTLTDVFTYTITDSNSATSTTQVTITIQGANDTPHNITAGALTVAENAANTTVVGSVTGSDVDAGETLSYTLVDNAGGRFSISSGGQISVANGSLLNYESLTSHSVTVRVTDTLGAFFEKAFTITVTDVNEFSTTAVTDSNATANSVAENSTIGTLVGITATASDADGTTNTITYSLDNSAGGLFAIDANSGVVTVAGAINREVAASYNIIVRATSSDTSFSTQSFTIAITDVNEFSVGSVSDTNASANSVVENATIGTTVGITASASDGDATNSGITYSLQNNDGGRFTIDANTGVVTVAGAINRETDGASRSITVRALSQDGSFTDQIFSISIVDANEFAVSTPTDTNATANTVAENAANGTLVGITANAFDSDATTNTVTYSLDDSASGRFTIDANTGVVTVAGAINREVAASYNIIVRATSSDTSFSTQSFTIAITDVNEFSVGSVSDTNASANSVVENATIGTTVGITASASDGDATNSGITYSLQNNDGGRFTIDANTGVVTVAGAINRETDGANRSITVRALSQDGSFTDQIFSISIVDANEFAVSTPTDTNASANSIAENSANGTLVGITANAFDSDATTNTVTYLLDDSAGGRFTIDANTGVVTVANSSLLNYESATSHSITVRANSVDGSSSTQTFTITLTDVNEFSTTAVTDSDATANSVAENSTIGTLVGITATASDADGTTNTITYSLDNNAGGLFAIDANTGVVTVAGAINREVAASYNIIVRATSSDTSFSTQSFTIAITDVNEFSVGSVSDTNASANSVVENATIGTVVGITASASDGDATNSGITYSLQNNDGGRFTIDANTGVVTVAGAINRETDGASRSITVRALSQDGSFTDQVFSISIVDANEFAVSTPTDTNASANSIAENSANGTLVGITANAFDSDATTNTVTYLLDDSAGGRFTIDANTGVVTVANSSLLNYESATSHSITVRANSVDGSSSTQTFTITLTDVNEFSTTAVTDSNATANSVAENSTIGTLVGITATASDADGTTNTITYSLDNNAGGLFAIDANSGVVTVAGAINREVAASYNIIVRATSSDTSFSTQSFTIAITDVNEFSVGSVSDTNASANSVVENATIGTVVGITASASDGDATNSGITYSCKTMTAVALQLMRIQV